jgi:hypothetical protein
MVAKTIQINRAPVLTLWAAVVAERMGLKEDEAPSSWPDNGFAVAGHDDCFSERGLPCENA